jgi:predicted Zn finger-like uncharacterized protein
MPIQLLCPGCKSRLRIKDEFAGKKVKCPRCEALVRVPAGGPVEVKPIDEGITPRRGGTAVKRQKPAPARRRRDEDEDEFDEREDDEGRPRSKWKPCPECGARGAKRVKFTWWGSWYGPALLNHVRCTKCGTTYNGKSGRSNLIGAILFVVVPLVGIAGVIGVIISILQSKGRWPPW